MKFFPQRRKDVLELYFAPLRLCGEKLLRTARQRRMASRLIAITIALSFVAMLLPIAGASANKSNTMPCCVGKAAGHCDSGLTAKKLPEPEEPMCGLHTDDSEDDGVTIVAEPSQTESHHASESTGTAAESASLSEPCQMDCGACATVSTRQQKRERGVGQPAIYQISPLTSLSNYDNLTVFFSSNENWEQTSPRGPPANLR